MGYPRKFQKLLEIELADVETPNTAWLTYAVCATTKDSCGWGGWMLEAAFKAPGEREEAESFDLLLSGAYEQVCPRCGGSTFRTGASVRMLLSPNQKPRLIPGDDYEVVPMEYEDD